MMRVLHNKISWLIAILSWSWIAGASAASYRSEGVLEKTAQALNTHLEQRASMLDAFGVILGFQGPAGRYWFGATGEKNLSSDPIGIDTIYSWGSITKWLTATLIMRLVEKGVVSLEDTLAQYGCDRGEGRCGWGMRNAEQITLRHLLTMRSGIANEFGLVVHANGALRIKYPSVSVLWRLALCTYGLIPPNSPLLQMTQDEYLYFQARRPMLFAPNTAFSYTNANFILLSKIIEEETGMSYFNFLQQEILQPLQLHSVYHANTADVRSAVGTNPAGNRDVRGCIGGFGSSAETLDSSNLPWGVSGSGGLRGTLQDLIRFARSFWSYELVSAESITLMATPGGPMGGPTQYGFGMMLTSSEPIQYGHNGGQSGFLTKVYYFPETGWIGAIMINSAEYLGVSPAQGKSFLDSSYYKLMRVR